MCEFKGRAHKPCPAVIERLSQGELQLLPPRARIASKQNRDADIDAWTLAIHI